MPPLKEARGAALVSMKTSSGSSLPVSDTSPQGSDDDEAVGARSDNNTTSNVNGTSIGNGNGNDSMSQLGNGVPNAAQSQTSAQTSAQTSSAAPAATPNKGVKQAATIKSPSRRALTSPLSNNPFLQNDRKRLSAAKQSHSRSTDPLSSPTNRSNHSAKSISSTSSKDKATFRPTLKSPLKSKTQAQPQTIRQQSHSDSNSDKMPIKTEQSSRITSDPPIAAANKLTEANAAAVSPQGITIDDTTSNVVTAQRGMTSAGANTTTSATAPVAIASVDDPAGCVHCADVTAPITPNGTATDTATCTGSTTNIQPAQQPSQRPESQDASSSSDDDENKDDVASSGDEMPSLIGNDDPSFVSNSERDSVVPEYEDDSDFSTSDGSESLYTKYPYGAMLPGMVAPATGTATGTATTAEGGNADFGGIPATAATTPGTALPEDAPLTPTGNGAFRHAAFASPKTKGILKTSKAAGLSSSDQDATSDPDAPAGGPASENGPQCEASATAAAVSDTTAQPGPDAESTQSNEAIVATTATLKGMTLDSDNGVATPATIATETPPALQHESAQVMDDARCSEGSSGVSNGAEAPAASVPVPAPVPATFTTRPASSSCSTSATNYDDHPKQVSIPKKNTIHIAENPAQTAPANDDEGVCVTATATADTNENASASAAETMGDDANVDKNEDESENGNHRTDAEQTAEDDAKMLTEIAPAPPVATTSDAIDDDQSSITEAQQVETKDDMDKPEASNGDNDDSAGDSELETKSELQQQQHQQAESDQSTAEGSEPAMTNLDQAEAPQHGSDESVQEAPTEAKDAQVDTMKEDAKMDMDKDTGNIDLDVVAAPATELHEPQKAQQLHDEQGINQDGGSNSNESRSSNSSKDDGGDQSSEGDGGSDSDSDSIRSIDDSDSGSDVSISSGCDVSVDTDDEHSTSDAHSPKQRLPIAFPKAASGTSAAAPITGEGGGNDQDQTSLTDESLAAKAEEADKDPASSPQQLQQAQLPVASTVPKPLEKKNEDHDKDKDQVDGARTDDKSPKPTSAMDADSDDSASDNNSDNDNHESEDEDNDSDAELNPNDSSDDDISVATESDEDVGRANNHAAASTLRPNMVPVRPLQNANPPSANQLTEPTNNTAARSAGMMSAGPTPPTTKPIRVAGRQPHPTPTQQQDDDSYDSDASYSSDDEREPVQAQRNKAPTLPDTRPNTAAPMSKFAAPGAKSSLSGVRSFQQSSQLNQQPPAVPIRPNIAPKPILKSAMKPQSRQHSPQRSTNAALHQQLHQNRHRHGNAQQRHAGRGNSHTRGHHNTGSDSDASVSSDEDDNARYVAQPRRGAAAFERRTVRHTASSTAMKAPIRAPPRSRSQPLKQAPALPTSRMQQQPVSTAGLQMPQRLMSPVATQSRRKVVRPQLSSSDSESDVSVTSHSDGDHSPQRGVHKRRQAGMPSQPRDRQPTSHRVDASSGSSNARGGMNYPTRGQPLKSAMKDSVSSSPPPPPVRRRHHHHQQQQQAQPPIKSSPWSQTQSKQERNINSSNNSSNSNQMPTQPRRRKPLDEQPSDSSSEDGESSQEASLEDSDVASIPTDSDSEGAPSPKLPRHQARNQPGLPTPSTAANRKPPAHAADSKFSSGRNSASADKAPAPARSVSDFGRRQPPARTKSSDIRDGGRDFVRAPPARTKSADMRGPPGTFARRQPPARTKSGSVGASPLRTMSGSLAAMRVSGGDVVRRPPPRTTSGSLASPVPRDASSGGDKVRRPPPRTKSGASSDNFVRRPPSRTKSGATAADTNPASTDAGAGASAGGFRRAPPTRTKSGAGRAGVASADGNRDVDANSSGPVVPTAGAGAASTADAKETIGGTGSSVGLGVGGQSRIAPLRSTSTDGFGPTRRAPPRTISAANSSMSSFLPVCIPEDEEVEHKDDREEILERNALSRKRSTEMLAAMSQMSLTMSRSSDKTTDGDRDDGESKTEPGDNTKSDAGSSGAAAGGPRRRPPPRTKSSDGFGGGGRRAPPRTKSSDKFGGGGRRAPPRTKSSDLSKMAPTNDAPRRSVPMRSKSSAGALMAGYDGSARSAAMERNALRRKQSGDMLSAMRAAATSAHTPGNRGAPKTSLARTKSMDVAMRRAPARSKSSGMSGIMSRDLSPIREKRGVRGAAARGPPSTLGGVGSSVSGGVGGITVGTHMTADKEAALTRNAARRQKSGDMLAAMSRAAGRAAPGRTRSNDGMMRRAPPRTKSTDIRAAVAAITPTIKEESGDEISVGSLSRASSQRSESSELQAMANGIRQTQDVS